VEGRADEVFHYGGVLIHPSVIRSVLVDTPDVLEYQVRQTSAGVDVLAVAETELGVTRLGRRLAAALAGAGLARPAVEVRTTPGLPRHPQTGKLTRFVPLC
jgi:phenylacetate-CoA ligase